MCSVIGGSGSIKDLGALQCHDRADYISYHANVIGLSLGHTPWEDWWSFFFTQWIVYLASSSCYQSPTKVALVWRTHRTENAQAKRWENKALFWARRYNSPGCLSPCIDSFLCMCMSSVGQSEWISGAFLHTVGLCFIHRLCPDPAELLFWQITSD